jgi:RNA-directed DNA polymerase
VRRLQARIVKATQEGRWGKVKALQRLLTHSYSAKVLAIRRVTENQGKRTPGVDGEIWDTSAKKTAGIAGMKKCGYCPKPLRRIYIPKSSNPEKNRPLGIPTMKDRAMQALYLLALEPVAETTADLNSYGFRKERSTADAIGQCFILLASRQRAPEWILEGDIKACFDQISHEWLLEHIPMDKTVLRKWLKAGYMEKNAFNPTEAGTPQGGIISPVLANMALDGLEKEIIENYRPNKSNRPSSGVHFVRYADDWIVTAHSKRILEEQILPHIAVFLRKRGLKLSTEKTHITHISEGFDFLGQNIRKYNGKLIIKPSKKNLKVHLKKLRDTIRANKTITAGMLIMKLNPILRGWANYHRHVCSKYMFRYVDRMVFIALWRWARRRHPNKGARWVRKKYFKTVGKRNWVFSGKVEDRKGKTRTVRLLAIGYTPIRRHVKIRNTANPYDPQWEVYFERRTQARMKYNLLGNKKLFNIWKAQDGRCKGCGQLISLQDNWHLHHVVWRSKGGNDNSGNLQILHPICHQQAHC